MDKIILKINKYMLCWKNYIQVMIRNNLYIPSKKITGLVPQEYIFLKWKYSKEIRYAKNPNTKAIAEINLENLFKPIFNNFLI